MKKTALFLAFVLLAFFVYQYKHETKPVLQKFDYSHCQYPARLSNPVGGCDNSDPACPEIIKGGECK